MSRTKSFKTQVVGGWLVRILQIGNNLLLIPLILAKIGPEQYGYWLATGGILAWAGAFDFGVAGLVKQRCALNLGKHDEKTAIKYFQAGLIIYSSLSLIAFAIIYGLSFTLESILSLPEANVELYQQTFLCAGVGLILSILRNVFAAYLQAAQIPMGAIVSSTIGQLLNLIVVVYLLLWTPLGLWAIPIGLLANHVSAVLTIATYAYLKTPILRVKPSFGRSVLRDYMATSPILFLSRLASQLTMKIEPTLIVIYLTPELATMYTVAQRLIEVMMGFANAVRGGMIAGFSHYFGEKGADATIDLLNRILQMTIGLSWAITMVYLASNRYFVGIWVGPDIYIGTIVCVLIGIDALTKSVGDSMIHLVGALGEMRRTSVAHLAESIAKVSLMLLLLPLIGVIGLPLAALLSAIGKLCYTISRLRENLNRVQLDMTRPIAGSTLALALLFCAILIGNYGTDQSPWLWLPLALTSSGIAAASFVIWAFPFVRREILAAYTHLLSRLPFANPKTP